ncbi:type VI secretion system baseplate subunit TssF [Undibacterium sp. TJN25]|uniref:type VI secretion system baseplate subunit TssF n=1 Tax=Undibacterium sp. TJN25 TaxID=3413056 RepID=UPI003BF08FF2
MDTKLLRYYERELQHLREMGGEFAREFPKIAGRLGLETYACADPYVERLLEGFSFLAARVQLKIDAEFPRFTEHLLELVYPQYLAPTPSMAIVQLQPDLTEGSLAEGFSLPRSTSLSSLLGKDDQTSCEYRTAHEVTMWPLELADAKYFTYSGELGGVELSRLGTIKAGLRLRLKTTAGLSFNEIALDKLPLYIRGSDSLPSKILEQILANAVGMVAMPTRNPASWHHIIHKSQIGRVGYEDEQALLPTGPRSFQGYRLMHEYFSFPQRYMFVELGGLQEAVKRCPDKEMDIVILFDRVEPTLEQNISAANFSMFCTPVINLFPKRADRVHLSEQQSEYHVVPDRTRPMDYEIYQVLGVKGYGTGPEAEQSFQPFYTSNDLLSATEQRAYYQVRRSQRVLSEKQRRKGPRSSYIGSEVFMSVVDASEAPFPTGLRQLGIDTLCTNRDLVLSMPVGSGKTDFTVESNAPVQSVRCLSGPTAPVPSYAEGETAWRLVSHLSLNYLSLIDSENKEAASALKDLLRLYCNPEDVSGQRQIEGIKSVTAKPIVRRLPVPGPITYGRGLQITVTIEESAFEGIGVFMLGAVLEQFFAKYVSLNSFTETIIRTPRRGEIIKWPARVGRCEIL